jgi:hypothetical protein
MRRLGCVLLLALLAALGAVGPPGRGAAQEGDVTALLAELQRAWLQGDAAAVAALFAPDAVIRIHPIDPHLRWGFYQDGPGAAAGGEVPAGAAPLALGVRTLLGSEEATRLDLAGRQTAVLGGEEPPATLVRWLYTRGGPASPGVAGILPPETGTDEVVIRGGRIAAYTRTPDPASLDARRQAARAAAPIAAPRVDGGPAAVTPPQATPGAGPWLLAVGLILVSAVILALSKRRTEP